jgi:hypothetical protein
MSIIKGTLLQEQSTLSAVSWLPLEGFSWNFIPGIPFTCATNIASMVEIGQILRALYIKSKVPFWLIAASMEGFSSKFKTHAIH